MEKLKKESEITPSGMYYQVLKEGQGAKPENGQTVKMHYAGYLPDGTLFDTSIKEVAEKEGKYDARREPYDPFAVQVGPQAGVIEGWKEALQMMQVGDKYKLIIPPNLGHGAPRCGRRNSTPIPG
ncbi:MAG: FKBP-type peptidyl-prolyl cis-trans isomerase [Owenweeksia sp.]|nr:FKBP-type peptidyl-prolyl cis-trans isomerase [Owenweeksia sp.]